MTALTLATHVFVFRVSDRAVRSKIPADAGKLVALIGHEIAFGEAWLSRIAWMLSPRTVGM